MAHCTDSKLDAPSEIEDETISCRTPVRDSATNPRVDRPVLSAKAIYEWRASARNCSVPGSGERSSCVGSGDPAIQLGSSETGA